MVNKFRSRPYLFSSSVLELIWISYPFRASSDGMILFLLNHSYTPPVLQTLDRRMKSNHETILTNCWQCSGRDKHSQVIFILLYNCLSMSYIVFHFTLVPYMFEGHSAIVCTHGGLILLFPMGVLPSSHIFFYLWHVKKLWVDNVMRRFKKNKNKNKDKRASWNTYKRNGGQKIWISIL